MWTDREKIALLEVFNETIDEVRILLKLSDVGRLGSGLQHSLANRDRRVCESLLKTLVNTRDELKVFGKTRSLYAATRRQIDAISQEKRVILEEKLIRAEVQRAQRKTKNLQEAWRKEVQELNEKIAGAQDAAHDTEMRIGMEEIYNENLLQVMVRCNLKGIVDEEAGEKKELDLLQQKILDEMNAHAHAARFLKDFLKDLGSQISQWHTKYERNMAMMQKEIEVLTKSREENAEKLNEEQKLLSERTAVVEEYLAEKAKEAEDLLRKHKENQAAIRIQSWWRGMMVRHRLGPYKPKRAKIRKKLASPKSDERSVKSDSKKPEGAAAKAGNSKQKQGLKPTSSAAKANKGAQLGVKKPPSKAVPAAAKKSAK